MSTTRTCINRYSLPTSVQWQFSGIPPPPQLLTPNLFHPSSGTGEFSGFGPCSGLGALPQDSKPNMPTTAIRLNVRVNSWTANYWLHLTLSKDFICIVLLYKQWYTKSINTQCISFCKNPEIPNYFITKRTKKAVQCCLFCCIRKMFRKFLLYIYKKKKISSHNI